MARVEKVAVDFEYNLSALTGPDLRVLDLALSYFKDTVRKNPETLPNPGDDGVLDNLLQAVLDIKRGD